MKPEDQNELNRKLWELEMRLTKEINRLRAELGQPFIDPPPPPNRIVTRGGGL